MNTNLSILELLEAIQSLRWTRLLLLLVLLVCVATPITGFVLGEFTDILDLSPGAAMDAPIQKGFFWALPAARFVATVTSMTLCLVLMLSAMVTALGGRGGAGSMTASFTWSLVLLMMVTPWERLLGGSIACGMLFNFGELATAYRAAQANANDLMGQIHYYGRFLGYPTLGFLVWVMVMFKSGKADRLSLGQGTSQLANPADTTYLAQ